MTELEREGERGLRIGPVRQGETLTREQVGELRAELTMGDLEAARAEVGDDPEGLAKHALRRRAAKLGRSSADADVAEFLDLVRVTDVAWAFSDAVRNPLSGGLATGPRSSDTGDSDPSTSTDDPVPTG